MATSKSKTRRKRRTLGSESGESSSKLEPWKMQPVKFQSRIDAGQKIAERLFGLKLDLFGESGSQNIVILAVPRGGIIIGDIAASELVATLDVVVSRKIGAPNNPELAIGAVMPDGSYFLNQEIVDMLNVSQEYIDIQASTQIKEIDRRLLSYRGNKEYDNEYQDKRLKV